MSVVKQRGAVVFLPSAGKDGMIVQRWGRSLETSVIKLSYADLNRRTECPSWGCPGLRTGVDVGIGHKAITGIPPAVASPPPLHDRSIAGSHPPAAGSLVDVVLGSAAFSYP
jgi:hypothetical protein